MKRLLVLLFVAASLASAAPAPSSLIANIHARSTISLNGVWRVIIDPYDTGLGGRYYENRKPKDQQDLVEYDFDTTGTLNVPGDWNSQRDSLFFYEGPIWYERSFSYHRNAASESSSTLARRIIKPVFISTANRSANTRAGSRLSTSK